MKVKSCKECFHYYRRYKGIKIGPCNKCFAYNSFLPLEDFKLSLHEFIYTQGEVL